MPFFQYMGPGTHIIDRINKGILPLNQDDAASLVHDIEYLKYDDQAIPDETAVSNAGYLSIPMDLAFKVKRLFGNIGNTSIKDYQKLRKIVDFDERFSALKQYKMHWSDGRPVRPHS